jgi:membrane-associated phospholipid phosphatase
MTQTNTTKAKAAAKQLTKAEAKATGAMQPLADNPLLSRLADLGDQPQLRTLSAAMIAAGLAAGRASGYGPRLARTGLRMLIAHELATAAKNFVKYRVDRTRPRSARAPGKDPVPTPGGSRDKEETSFPSGHAAGSSAVARAFAREYGEHKGVAAGVGGILALVQLPRCAHYPTDVAAGLAIGLLAEGALAALWPVPSSSASASLTTSEETPSCATS